MAMPSTPPFIKQEQAETCMLACLRMILAYHGADVSEETLASQVSMAEGGLDPDALATLAGRYELTAKASQIDVEEIAELVARRRFPIVLVDRSLLDGEFSVHAVIPIGVSRHFVRVLDPLRGERRLSLRKFAKAARRVAGWAVVWEPLPSKNSR